jgi:membrane-associated protease RseP (regulator of RpoE activity)
MILLAASTQAALAWGNGGADAESANGISLFMVGGSGTAPVRVAQGYLGVDVRDVSPEQLVSLKLKEARGAVIVLVDHDAPAGKAGLREHDVILQMNGQAIESQDQLRRMLHESPPGRTVVLLLSRDGQQITVTTQMANREEVERQAWEHHLVVPEPPAPAADSADSDPNPVPPPPPVHGNSFIGSMLMNPTYTGAMLEQVSSELAAFFGVQGGGGLFVRSVATNSPAALAGMRTGDLVVKANAQRVFTAADWAKAVRNSHGHPLAIVVLRDKKEQTLTLTPDAKKRSSLDQPAQRPTAEAVARLGFSWMPQSSVAVCPQFPQPDRCLPGHRFVS